MVEILIAIVLVGILSAVVVVGVARLTDTGNAAACTASADAARAGSMSYFAAHLAQPTTLAQLISPDDYLTLDDAVTLNTTAVGSYPAGTVATGPGWTLTITPGANGRSPTFTCNAGTAPPAPSGTALCPGQYTGWVAEYYTNTALTGAPTLCRDDATIDFNWGGGAPAATIPADNFSIRWTRTATFTAGAHSFTVGSDDGNRLYIDGVLVLDTWNDQSYATRSVTHTLTAGPHEIRLEFYERGGLARATLTWT